MGGVAMAREYASLFDAGLWAFLAPLFAWYVILQCSEHQAGRDV